MSTQYMSMEAFTKLIRQLIQEELQKAKDNLSESSKKSKEGKQGKV